MKKFFLLPWILAAAAALTAQNVTLPPPGGNLKASTALRIGITDVTINYGAPGVKGREGKIWGTPIVHYGFQNLGFGTAKESPWRAGANENTTISFSTDVKVEGKKLAAGKYGLFMAVYADSATIIFSKANQAWGSYFYNPADDALRVSVRQQKDMPESREWLTYEFSDPTENSAVVALRWERWRIPFRVEVDLNTTVMTSLRRELAGAPSFYDLNLVNAAQWALDHNTGLEDALGWATAAATPPTGRETFLSLNLKSRIEEKLGRQAEADKTMAVAMEKASVTELHQYGRQLLMQKNTARALEVFQLNHKRNGDTWPVHVGLARGYSASGDLKKALEHAKKALAQAPDDLNRRNLEAMVKTLGEGKAVPQ
jgi:tetratricopeptide (TPR) repeat protein